MSEFTRADYLRIKWPFVAIACSLVLSGSLFAGLRVLDKQAVAELRQTRERFTEAQERVDKIELEEQTILANVDEYRLIEAAGLVQGEDRLQMREYFAELRAEYNLFPINVSFAELNELPLEYGELTGEKVADPGRPIAVEVSEVEFGLPLLHEDDFSHLVAGLLAKPELLQLHDCTLTANGGQNRNYLRLGQHFRASCQMSWYTFKIDETAETDAAAAREQR